MVLKKLTIESEDGHEIEKALRHDDMCFALSEILKIIEKAVKENAESPSSTLANKLYYEVHNIIESLELSSIIYHSQKVLTKTL